jgi:hypothetical protein
MSIIGRRLIMAAKDLGTRVQILEDTEAIKGVMAQYLYFMDAGHKDPSQMQKVIKLYGKDSTFKFPGVGSGKGRADTVRFYTKTFPTAFTFTMHMVHSPLIRVKGRKATGEWYSLVCCTLRDTNKAAWYSGKYKNEFVKEGNEWKFKKVVWKPIFAAPYEEGWAGKAG